MIKEFCTAIGYGYTIAEALAYADSQVLAQYGISGFTNNRLVREDTDVLTIYYSSESSAANGYCRIGTTYYYFPRIFVDYIDNILNP